MWEVEKYVGSKQQTFFFFIVSGIEPWALLMLHKPSTNKLHIQPNNALLNSQTTN
jgi:hypothetical protein